MFSDLGAGTERETVRAEEANNNNSKGVMMKNVWGQREERSGSDKNLRKATIGVFELGRTLHA